MFTLKFFTGADSHVVQAGSYTINHHLTPDQSRADGAVVCVYPGATTQDGVEFRVGFHDMERDSSHPHPGVCYVENSAGKTIDTIRA